MQLSSLIGVPIILLLDIVSGETTQEKITTASTYWLIFSFIMALHRHVYVIIQEPSGRLRREIGSQRLEVGVADLRLAKRRHDGHAGANERPRQLRHEIGALLERSGFRALIERLERLRPRVPRPRRMTGCAPSRENLAAASGGSILRVRRPSDGHPRHDEPGRSPHPRTLTRAARAQ